MRDLNSKKHRHCCRCFLLKIVCKTLSCLITFYYICIIKNNKNFIDMKTLSIEQLNEAFYNVCKSDFRLLEQYLRNRYMVENPVKPSRPVLQKDATSDDALKYAELLKRFESDSEVFMSELKVYKDKCQLIDKQIVDLIYDISGLNNIPEQYRDKVYNYAYQAGHAYGYQEIYSKLQDLVEIFE